MYFDVLIIRQIPPIQKGEISSSFCNFFGITPSVTTSSCHSFHRLRAVPLPRGGRYKGANTNNLQINVSSSEKNLFFVRWTAYAPELPPRGREACRPLCGSQASGTPKVCQRSWLKESSARLTEGVHLSEISLPSGSPISGAHQSRKACVTPLPASLMYSSGIFFSTSITSFTSMSVVRTR